MGRALGNPNEWLVKNSLDFARQEAGIGPNAPLLDAVRAVSAQKADAKGVFALKVMWNDFHSVVEGIRQECADMQALDLAQVVIRAFPNPKFIYLYRRDVVQQAVSYVKAEQSGIWSLADKQDRSRDEQESLIFQFDDIQARIAQIEHMNVKWRTFFAKSGFECLEVAYEDVESSPYDCLCRIAGYLHKPVPPTNTLSGNPHVKMRDSLNSKWCNRYQSMAARSVKNDQFHAERFMIDGLRATFRCTRKHYSAHRNDKLLLPIEVVNSGDQKWPCIGRSNLDGSVVLMTRLIDDVSSKVVHSRRIFFEEDVDSFKSINLTVPVVAPCRYGRFRVELEIRQIGNANSKASSLVVLLEVIPTWVERQWTEYFPNAVETSWGWRYDPVFGYFNTLQFPWLFHSELGWIFCSGTGGQGNDYWIWDWELGLLWTSENDFPFLYSFDRDSWLEYERESREPRRFYDLARETWITVERIG